ncbi:hypothetical protein AKO1_007402 [Acrasis kona]|uniref:Dynein heavy chain C-terminal domain-containing protein n=1 Tax=Acrasis kona TaxID=1008807 RepID=A0AAW2YSF9_9EUKA
MDWISRLENETPSWCGLPDQVNKMMLIKNASDMMQKVRMLNAQDDVIRSSPDSNANQSVQSEASSYGNTLKPLICDWLKWLPSPSSDQVLKINSNKIKHSQLCEESPLFRYFSRELTTACDLLWCVTRDLEELIAVCDGTIKVTNHHRDLIQALSKGAVPSSWRLYELPQSLLTVDAFLRDLKNRMVHYGDLCKSVTKNEKFTTDSIWLGGLFSPEAFLTAMREYVAQVQHLPLETLELQVCTEDDYDFVVSGLQMESGEYVEHKVVPTQALSTPLTNLKLKWAQAQEQQSPMLKVPFYLNSNRTTMLCTLPLQHEAQDANLLRQRGLAIIAWN